jgi:hypothetical protein
LGGVYSVAALFLRLNGGIAFTIDIAVLALMCLIAYGIKKTGIRSYLKAFFLYFLVSALLGGLMTALFSLFNNIDFLRELGENDEGIDVWAFALLAIIGSALSVRGGRIFRSSLSERVVELEIEYMGKGKKLHALVDSGNLATEPISGRGVIFINIEKCNKIIEERLYNSIKNNSIVDDVEMTLSYKIRFVPARSISDYTLLPAMKFDHVILKKGKKSKELDVYVAFVSGETIGKFDAIISHEATV